MSDFEIYEKRFELTLRHVLNSFDEALSDQDLMAVSYLCESLNQILLQVVKKMGEYQNAKLN